MSSVAINHPLYVQVVKNLDRVVVRDKLLRLIQYFSRFASYYTLRKGYPGQVVAQLQALQKNISLARKAFRAGKPLQNLRALVQELSAQTTPSVEHFATIARNVGTGIFLSLDTLMFLQTTGAYTFKSPTAKRIANTANWFWLLSISANIVESGYNTYVERQRQAALGSEEKAAAGEITKSKAAEKKANTVLVWNLLDAIIPLTNLGVLNASDGFVGLAGTITSYIGLKATW